MKNIVKKSLAAALLAFGFAAPVMGQAAPVAQKSTQAPGYYHMMVGPMQITALYDGNVDLGPELFKGLEAKDIQALMAEMFQKTTPGAQTAVNAYLVNTGKNLILIDAGTANCFGPALGGVVGNLKAAGYKPEDVDSVLLTHLHADHACGINDNGKAVFPKANVYVSNAEAGFWLNQDNLARADANMKPFFKMAQESVIPYAGNGRLKLYAPGEEIVEGVKVVPAPGHTPGHTAYLLAAGDQSILLWGDIVHNHALQFARPEVYADFDVDGKTAIETRKKLFADAANGKFWVGGAHLPFPGLGHVGKSGDAYRWIPVDYAPLPEKKN